jgi:hypothetical protein
MSVNLSPVGNGFQFFTNNGEPLVGGKLDTYQAGSTTPLTTFTDSSGLIPNTNPIILGTDGRPPDTIWLSEGFFYKFVLSDANDVQIQVYDNLYGIIGVSPPAATPSPLAALFCGLDRLDLSLRDMFSVTETTQPQTLETVLLWARVRPMRWMPRVALRMQPCQHTRTRLHRWSQIQVTNIRFHQVEVAHQTMPLVALLDHFLHHKQLASNQLASRLQPPTPTQEPLALTPTCPRTMRFATL